MQVKDLISKLAEQFESAGLCFAHGTDNADDEACFLVFAALELDWQEFESEAQRAVTESERVKIEELASRRIKERLPVAYLVGRTWFAGYPFHADERALVPRSPIAELLENRLEPLLSAQPQHILDLCCGGGCIGLAAALQFSEVEVDLADLSADALQLAAENAQLHGVEQRVCLIRSDLFEGLSGRRYDLIISNPPYVSAAEIAALPREFRHEPGMGLLSDDEGLAIPLQILSQAADFLTDRGILILEVGYSNQALAARCKHVPFLWLEFEHGGEGVLMMTRSQLLQYRDSFI